MNCYSAIAISSVALLTLLISGVDAVLAYNVTYVELPIIPTDIGFSRIDGTTYVVGGGDGNGIVQVLDGQNNTIIDSVDIEIDSPRNVAFDDEHGNLYIRACNTGQLTFGCSIHVMDGQNNTIIDKIPIPTQAGPLVRGDIASNPDDGDIFLLESPFSSEDFMTQGVVYIIDNTNKSIFRTLETGFGDNPSNLVINSNNSKAYVINQGFGPMSGAQGTLSIIDDSRDRIESTVPVGVLPFVIGSNPINGKTYVGNLESKTISVIDGRDNIVTKTIDIEGIPTDIAFNPSNGNMYLTSGFPNSTIVISGLNDTVIQTIPLEGVPEGIASEPSTGRMLVGLNVNPAAIAVIDDKTNSVVEKVPLKMEALGIDFNPANEKFYIRNSLNGTLGIIESE